MINCKICNKEFSNIKGLSSHIRQTHKISSEEYYVKYINANHSCKICGKPTKFNDLTRGFYQYCSYQCMNSDKDKIEQQITTFKSNIENIKQARNNMIQYNKSDIGRQNSSRIGKVTGGKAFIKGHKECDGIKWCEVCQEYTMHVLGIGCMTCYNRSEKHKNNIINGIKTKYGTDYSNVFQVPEIKEKSIQTSLKKYNTTNAGNSKEARQKANETMRKNGNYSKWEDYFEEQLQQLSMSYLKQYESIEYPFLCDFYLPDTDTYIEINGYWSHGYHWFDKNNEKDIETLNKWIEKANNGHKQYQNAIKVWTVKDVQKRTTAINNRLNYIVLWNKHDIDEFIKNLVI